MQLVFQPKLTQAVTFFSFKLIHLDTRYYALIVTKALKGMHKDIFVMVLPYISWEINIELTEDWDTPPFEVLQFHLCTNFEHFLAFA